MKRFFLLLGACALITSCAHSKDIVAKPNNSAGQNMTISQSGKTTYTIALAADAIQPEKTAASQLQHYLQQVTGATFTIRPEGEVKPAAPQILVGAGTRVKKLLPKQDWKALGSDGIVIKTVGKSLILAGGRPRGSLYAVFQFLEDAVGCRWWTPTENRIPQKSTLSFPAQNVVYTPPFSYREHYATTVQADPVFATILRENGRHQQQTSEWGGHYNILGFVHTFSVLLPPEKYFKDHPEWYTDPNNGSKPSTASSKMPDGQLTQLCLSNPEVLKELTAQALLMIEKEPEAGYISISQNDNDNYCQCPECSEVVRREGSQSGPIVQFVNQVAKEIYQHYPDFWVETLAYRGSETPPKTIRPANNVLIRLAPISADFGRPLDSDGNKKARNDLLQWAEIAPNLFVWNYVTNFNSTLLPHPNWDGLAKDLRFFAANKVVGVFEQGNAYTNSVGDFAPLRVWLIGKLMWNPNLDQAKLTDEFLKGYYGLAAPHLKQYIDLVQQAFLQRNRALSLSNRDFSFLKLDEMNRATQLFQKAESAVKGDEVLSKRLQRERLSLDLAWLVRYKGLKSEASQPGQEFLGPNDGPKALQQAVKTAKDFGVGLWGEGMPLEKHIPVIEGQFRPTVLLSEFARKFPVDDVIDIQDLDFRMHNRGVVTFFEDDPAASDKKAASIIGNNAEWAVQAELNQTPVATTPEKWHLYAMIRATLKPGAMNDGIGLSIGIYDDTHPPAQITSEVFPLKSLASNEYQIIDLGVKSVMKTSYVWFAPQLNPAVEKFYIDRMILIRENNG